MTEKEWNKADKTIGKLWSGPNGMKYGVDRQIGRATGYCARGVSVTWERAGTGGRDINRWSLPDTAFWPYQCIEEVKP